MVASCLVFLCVRIFDKHNQEPGERGDSGAENTDLFSLVDGLPLHKVSSPAGFVAKLAVTPDVSE